MKSFKLASFLFFAQVVSYAVITYNYRAIAHGNLYGALASDALNATFSFFVIKRIAKSDDALVPWMGHVLGSLCGTWIGMHI
jgi:hypothetical protein